MSTIRNPSSSLLCILNCLLFSLCLLTLFTGYLSEAVKLSDDLQFNKTINANRHQAILVKSGFSKVLFDYIDENVNQLEHLGVSTKCVNSLKYLNTSLHNGHSWAFKMLDASGRLPLDFTGNGYVDLGGFENCVKLDWLNSSGSTESGKHCLVAVVPTPSEPGTAIDLFTSIKVLSDYDTSFSLRIGFCIPSSCQRNDLNIMLSKALEPFSWTVFQVDACQIKKSFIDKLIKASNLQKISFAFLATFVSLVLYSTWIDVISRRSSRGKNQFADRFWVRSFSILTNWKNMIEPDAEMNRCPTLTRCGLTQHVIVLFFHAIIWPVITGAIAIYALGNPLVKHKDSELLKHTIADWFMDGLFAYAGFCKANEIWRKFNAKTPIWRIFNSITKKMLILICLFTILISIELILPLFTSGPFHPLIAEKNAETCHRTFTANILFYQNYIGSLDKVCIAHSWSLAAEYQMIFFLAALVILYKRSPKLALSLNVAAIIGGLFNVGRVFYHSNLPVHPISNGFDPRVLSMWSELVYLPASMKFWLYISTPLWTYLIMTDHLANYLTKNKRKFRLGMYYIAAFIMVMPALRSLLPIDESPMSNAVYIVSYRIFTGIFYTFLVFHNADEFRDYFGTDPKDTISNNNNDNNNNLMTSDRKIIDDSVNQLASKLIENKTLKYVSGKTEYQILHILTVIFKSTYCIHIPVLLWYYSQHKYPVLTVSEWAFHLFATVFLSIGSGIIFFLLILGPFTNITEAIKPKDKQPKLTNHLKDE